MKLSRTARIAVAFLGTVAVTTLAGCAGDEPAPAPAATTAAPAATTSATTPAVAIPAGSKIAVSKKPAPGPLGEIISTGMDVTPISEWVIYGEVVDNKNSPDTTFGFALGERANNGKVTQYTDSYESFTPELAPGFHVPERAYTLQDDIEQPAYGYFVGTPAKITGTVDGKTVVAKRAVWSKNSSVTVFWFDNTKVTGDTKLTTVMAYDAAGKQTAHARVYGIGE